MANCKGRYRVFSVTGGGVYDVKQKRPRETQNECSKRTALVDFGRNFTVSAAVQKKKMNLLLFVYKMMRGMFCRLQVTGVVLLLRI